MRYHTPIDGPDFLDEYADRLAANSLTIEADQIRRIRDQWNAERAENQRSANHATCLENQLSTARKALQPVANSH